MPDLHERRAPLQMNIACSQETADQVDAILAVTVYGDYRKLPMPRTAWFAGLVDREYKRLVKQGRIIEEVQK